MGEAIMDVSTKELFYNWKFYGPYWLQKMNIYRFIAFIIIY